MNRVVKTFISVVTAAIMIMGLFMVQGINAHAEGAPGYYISYSQDEGFFTYNGNTVNAGDIIPADSTLNIWARSNYPATQGGYTNVYVYVDNEKVTLASCYTSENSPVKKEYTTTADIKYVRTDEDIKTTIHTAEYKLYFETVQDPGPQTDGYAAGLSVNSNGVATSYFSYNGSDVAEGSILSAGTSISPVKAEAGTGYSATIKVCIDGNLETVANAQAQQIMTTDYYINNNIKYNGSSYSDAGADKTYILMFETVGDPAPSAAKSDYVPHEHSYAYTVITEPTENSVGEAAWVCSCGDSKDHVILPAIDVLMDNRVTQITQAKAGQDIVLNMGLTNSLPNWFMQKISEKNDVNFKIIIKYDHKKYEISIPRGTEIDLSCDWYGPAKLMELYETTQLN